MSRKLFCTVLAAVMIFGVVVCGIEFGLKPGLVVSGCVLGFGLAFGFLNLRNKFFVFAMLLTLLLVGYFTWKHACREILLSLPVGAVVGLLLVWGWVQPHHSFRRSSYVAAQAERKEDKSHHE